MSDDDWDENQPVAGRLESNAKFEENFKGIVHIFIQEMIGNFANISSSDRVPYKPTPTREYDRNDRNNSREINNDYQERNYSRPSNSYRDAPRQFGNRDGENNRFEEPRRFRDEGAVNFDRSERSRGGRLENDNFNSEHKRDTPDQFSQGVPKRRFEDEEGKTRPPLYTPQGPSDAVEDIFQKNVIEGIDFDKYKNIKVQISGGDKMQDVIQSFDTNSGISQSVVDNITHCGYKTPTPVQKFTIPIILKGEYDIMGCAQTGSGKTAAFIIPIFTRIIEEGCAHDESIIAPELLVLVPTRELSCQIWSDMRKLAYGTSIRTGVVYGGVSRQFLMKYLSRGCDALAATPGRLLDFCNRGEVSLKNLKYLVLDEADRMLDMGFIGDIRKIIYSVGMPDAMRRKCYMFSATFPVEIQKLARDILAPDYYFLTVGIVGGAADSIKQEIFSIFPQHKRDKLVEILQQYSNSKTLIFVETKRSADFLTTFLCQKNVKATSIHGDRFQEQREEALRSFKTGYTPVLVATSVAARGLDIHGVDVVVNFDLPSDIDEYVHRIGRTGRLGNKGSAISFFTPGTNDLLAPLLLTANQDIPDFLTNYDYSSTGSTRNFVHSKDDREISKRLYRAYSSNAPDNTGLNFTPTSVSEVVDETWD
ncbi:hypothetical protein MXB_1870 [Myxobolus squamalis]|nr:hypothetical protein MXB_1870 [Myxobolus squamalis]